MRQGLLKTIAAFTLAAAMIVTDASPLAVSSTAYAAEAGRENVNFENGSIITGANSIEENLNAKSTVAAPTASRKSGKIKCSKDYAKIELTADSGSTIYYSLNGAKYKKYTKAIKLTKNSTIKTYAKLNGKKSSVVKYKYKLVPKFKFSESGSDSKKIVKLSSGVSDVKFYYTTDGSKPTTESKLYTSSGIKLTKSCTLRVLAVKKGWSSMSASKEYVVVSKPIEEVPDYLEYERSWDGRAEIYITGLKSGYENVSSVVIPAEIEGLPVTSIDDFAFYECNSLSSIEIPDSVTSIGYSAFAECSSLSSIEIPDSVTSIGYWAFAECSSLRSIEIPESVTSIGDNVFMDTPWLEEQLRKKELVIVNSIVIACREEATDIKIPDGVTSIGAFAFSGCSSLSSIEIPDSVKSIGDCAFSGCSSLSSIKIPDSVTSIGWQAFSGCDSLSSIEIPDSVTSIGDWAFSRCSSLSSIIVKKGSYAEQWAKENGFEDLLVVK